MSSIPLIASAADLPGAIRYAERNPGSRWYVARRAAALDLQNAVPAEWLESGLTAAFGGDWSPPSREKAESKGEAMEGGSFPIKDVADLKRAIKALGRAKDKDAAKKHIIKRARALKAVAELPESWSITAAAHPGDAAKKAIKIVWTEGLHPRDKEGEWIPKGGPVDVSVPGGGIRRFNAIGARTTSDGREVIQVKAAPELLELMKKRHGAWNLPAPDADGVVEVENDRITVAPEIKGKYKPDLTPTESNRPPDLDEDEEALFDVDGQNASDFADYDPVEVIADYDAAIEKYPDYRDHLLGEAQKFLDAVKAQGGGGESTGYASFKEVEGLDRYEQAVDEFNMLKGKSATPGPEAGVDEEAVSKALDMGLPTDATGDLADVEEDDQDLFDGGQLYVSLDYRDPEGAVERYRDAINKYPQHRDRLIEEGTVYLDMEQEAWDKGVGGEDDPDYDPDYVAELGRARAEWAKIAAGPDESEAFDAEDWDPTSMLESAAGHDFEGQTANLEELFNDRLDQIDAMPDGDNKELARNAVAEALDMERTSWGKGASPEDLGVSDEEFDQIDAQHEAMIAKYEARLEGGSPVSPGPGPEPTPPAAPGTAVPLNYKASTGHHRPLPPHSGRPGSSRPGPTRGRALGSPRAAAS